MAAVTQKLRESISASRLGRAGQEGAVAETIVRCRFCGRSGWSVMERKDADIWLSNCLRGKEPSRSEEKVEPDRCF